MTTEATIGYSTILAYEIIASPGNFATFAEVTGLSGPSIAVDTIDATHMQSPQAVREFIPGLIDGGEVGVEANFLPANATQGAAAGALYICMNRLKVNWRMTFPTVPVITWTLPCIMSGFEPDTPLDDKMALSLTLKVAGVCILA